MSVATNDERLACNCTSEEWEDADARYRVSRMEVIRRSVGVDTVCTGVWHHWAYGGSQEIPVVETLAVSRIGMTQSLLRPEGRKKELVDRIVSMWPCG